VDKSVNLLINGSLFTGISTTTAANGIVITVTGGTGSSVVVHSSNFSVGISAGSVGTTLGGAIYVGNSTLVEVDGSTFTQIENVASGGAIYVASSGSVVIIACSFDNITVKVAGGVII
jgi:hypothetical protein